MKRKKEDLGPLININIINRLISALALSFVFIFTLFNYLTIFNAFIIVACILSFFELTRIMNFSNMDKLINLLCILLLNVIFFNYLLIIYFYIFIIFITLFPLIIFYDELFGKIKKIIPCLYIAPFFYTIYHLQIENIYLILFIFIGVWSVDIGGYVFGKTIGKRKLFPIISPKKTYEGLFGSIILVSISCYLINIIYLNFLPSSLFFMIVTILVSSVFGDFFESFIKRKYSVKDSGSIIPGHGGVLDRLDSSFLALPMCFLAYEFI